MSVIMPRNYLDKQFPASFHFRPNVFLEVKKRLPSTRGLTSSSVYQLLWALSSWVCPWSLEEASTYSTWSTTASLASLSLFLASSSASHSTGYMVSKMVKKVVIEVNHALQCPVQSMSSQTALIRDFVTFFTSQFIHTFWYPSLLCLSNNDSFDCTFHNTKSQRIFKGTTLSG